MLRLMLDEREFLSPYGIRAVSQRHATIRTCWLRTMAPLWPLGLARILYGYLWWQQSGWTIPFNPGYQAEARVYAQHILKNVPDARIGILYQNDDYGKDRGPKEDAAPGELRDPVIVSPSRP